jgi:hypothetical protein
VFCIAYNTIGKQSVLITGEILHINDCKDGLNRNAQGAVVEQLLVRCAHQDVMTHLS